jgi:hypothetical protein
VPGIGRFENWHAVPLSLTGSSLQSLLGKDSLHGIFASRSQGPFTWPLKMFFGVQVS